MSESTHEQLQSIPPSLAELQAGRELNAQRAAEAYMRAAFDPGIVYDARCAIGSVKRNTFGQYDEAVIGANTLLSLEAVGVSAHDVLQKSSEAEIDEQIDSVVVGPDKLDILSYDRGLSFRLNSVVEHGGKDDQPSEAINKAFRDRLLQSPAHQALLRASDSLQGANEIPKVLRTEPFDYKKDPLGSLVFFDSIGLTDSSRRNKPAEVIAKDDVTNEQLLQTILDADVASGKGRSVVHRDGSTVVTWQYRPSSPMTKQIELRDDGTCVYSAEQVAINAYLEQANQSSEAITLPFIESQTARDLVKTLDAAGLMFDPKIQHEMMSVDEADRYGSIYTQLSRQVAKWVDNPDSFRLSDLFALQDDEYAGLKLAESNKYKLYEYSDKRQAENTDAYEQSVRSAYAAVARDPNMSEPAEVLFNMIDDLLAISADPTSERITDLPVTSERVGIRNGACFDVVAYYVGAIDEGRGGLHRYEANSVPMIEKKHGSHTFLTSAAIRFNGVRLPKGSLFSQAQDGGWAFLRLTPFAFDKTADQLAFGSEITKMLVNEKRAVARIGEATLQNIVDYAHK